MSFGNRRQERDAIEKLYSVIYQRESLSIGEQEEGKGIENR